MTAPLDLQRVKTTLKSIEDAMEQPVLTEAVPGTKAVRLVPGQLKTVYALAEARSTLKAILETYAQVG